MHLPLPEQGGWLRQVLTGYFAYHAVPTNFGHCGRSTARSGTSGDASYHGVASEAASRGIGFSRLLLLGSRCRASCTFAPNNASTFATRVEPSA